MESRLRDLERRVAALEAILQGETRAAAGIETRDLAAEASSPNRLGREDGAIDRPPIATLTGRVFLGLAGAFMLRAAADEGVVSLTLGVTLGLAYALAWLLTADRFRTRSKSRRASVHAYIAAAIAYPLLWEAGGQRHIVAPAAALILTGAITGAFLVTAHRIGRQALAVTALSGALAVASGIYWTTDGKGAACLLMMVISAVAGAHAVERGWLVGRWIAAPLTNIVLLMPLLHAGGAGAVAGDGYPTAVTVLLLAVGQFLLVTGLAGRALLGLRRGADPFLILQTCITMALAFGAAFVFVRTGGAPTAAVGAVALIAGVGLYVAAFVRVQRSHGQGAAFYYTSTVALLMVLTGAAFLPTYGWVGIIWMVLALAAAAVGSRRSRLTLRFHGAAITLVALFVTGTLAAAWPPLSRASETAALDAHHLINFGLVVLCSWILATTVLPPDAARVRRMPLAIVIGAAAVLTAGLTAQAALAAWPGEALNAGGEAAARTVAGCLVVVVLVITGGILQRPEPGWVVLPVLVALGAKLLLEDLGAGTSGTRFLGFLVYGGAWIASARTVRAARRQESNPEAAPNEVVETDRTVRENEQAARSRQPPGDV